MADTASSRATTSMGGAQLTTLETMVDHRGSVTELHAASWGLPSAAQWTRFDGVAGGFRGVHVHARKTDVVTVLAGTIIVGTRDLRESSSTSDQGAIRELSGGQPALLTIPPGVAHGFYSPDASILLVATTHEYDPTDDYACRWDDPELDLEWPMRSSPLLSERDANAGTMSEMIAALRIVGT